MQGPMVTFINASQSGTSNVHINFAFETPVQLPGTYNVSAITVQGYTGMNTVLSPSTVTLTSFPQAVGAFYEGSFTIQFKDAQNVNHNVSGNFRLRRNW